MNGTDTIPGFGHPALTRAQRGARVAVNGPAWLLTQQVRGHLDAAAALFTALLDDDVDGPDTLTHPTMRALTAALGHTLRRYADVGDDSYAGMLIRDHLEAWENDGVGTPVDELAGLLDELLEQKPHRHVHLTARALHVGVDHTDVRLRLDMEGRESAVRALAQLLDAFALGEVERAELYVARGPV